MVMLQRRNYPFMVISYVPLFQLIFEFDPDAWCVGVGSDGGMDGVLCHNPGGAYQR